MRGVSIGKNIAAALKEGASRVVVLTVDPQTIVGPSSSGKTDLLASVNTPLGATKATLGANFFVKSGVKPVITETELVEVGKNVAWQMKDSLLRVELDLSNAENEKDASASGKTILLASSKGNRPLGTSMITMGLNAYIKVGETFQPPALAKWLAADGSTTVGPFAYSATESHYVFSATLEDDAEKLTTKTFVGFDGGNKIQMTLSKDGSTPLTSTDGWVAAAQTANIEFNIDATSGLVQMRMRRDGNFGPSNTGKSIVLASSKTAKSFNGLRLTINAIRPGPKLSAADVLQKVTEFLEERDFDLKNIKEKDLREFVAENVTPKQDVASPEFKQLVREQLQAAVAKSGRSIAAAIAPSSSQASKRSREDDSDDDGAKE